MRSNGIRDAAGCAVLLLAALGCGLCQDGVAEKERLRRGEAGTSLDVEGMAPWHLRLGVQLIDNRGKAGESGTVEEWWSGPGMYRIVYMFPSYKETRVVNKEGTFGAGNGGLPPYFADLLLGQTVHPMRAAAAEFERARPELLKHAFGKVKLDCVLLNRVSTMPLDAQVGLFPTFCFEVGQDTLRVSKELTVQGVIRQQIGRFRGREVGTAIEVDMDGIVTARSKVEALEGRPEASTDTLKTDGLVAEEDHGTPVSVGDRAGTILNKVPPIYPQSAKSRRVQGTVVMRVVIGKDGHVLTLEVESRGDADLAAAAVEAVRQWTYKPYTVNGKAVEVQTMIKVNFSIGVS